MGLPEGLQPRVDVDPAVSPVSLEPVQQVDRVISVSLSPDGKRIVSGSLDDTLKVWDISSLDTSK